MNDDNFEPGPMPFFLGVVYGIVITLFVQWSLGVIR